MKMVDTRIRNSKKLQYKPRTEGISDKSYKYVDVFEPLPWQIEPLNCKDPVMLLTGSAGGGKALALDTIIPTPSGATTMGDVSVGDHVLGGDGSPVMVIGATDVMHDRKCYRITFDDGTTVDCDAMHLWLTSTVASRASARNYAKRINKMGGAYNNNPRGTDQRHKRVLDSIVTAEEISRTLRTNKRGNRINHAVYVAPPININGTDLRIDPYLLGAWLGDGSSSSAEIAIHDDDIQIIEEVQGAGYNAKKGNGKYRWSLGYNDLLVDLRFYNIFADKRIPIEYLRASFDSRLSVLQGIVDTDGHIGKNGRISIDLAKLDLLEDIRELVCSLGIKCSQISSGTVTLNEKEFERYRMSFRTTLPVARLKRKRKRIASKIRDTQNRRYIVHVEEIDSVPVRCIQVDSDDGLFLVTRSFIPTHNSRCAAEKVHAYCLRYPGSTALVLRKTKTSMENSVVAFMKSSIMKRYLASGKVTHNTTRQRFEYDNDSVIIYSGMATDKQREAIRSVGESGGVDITWMEEAHLFEEGDYEEIIPRMRGNAAPWRQIIVTTNPDAPTHWIYRRLILGGEATVFLSRARDNIHNPEDYEKNQLGKLRGVMRKRLVEGQWAQAGNLVLDSWVNKYDKTGDHGGNVTEDADYIPDGGDVVWWVDDGYAGKYDAKTKSFVAGSHPRVFVFAQIRYDGIIAVFDEDYAVKTLAPEHLHKVMTKHERLGYPKPYRVVYDKAAASLGGFLKKILGERWGISKSDIVYNAVPVAAGNTELNTRLAPDENGVREVIVHPRCRHILFEMVSYKRNPDGRIIKDFDHGPDAIRIGLWDHVNGGPSEQDAASEYDVDVSAAMELDEGIAVYEDGTTSVAAII